MTEQEWWRQLFLAALREEGIINPERFMVPISGGFYAEDMQSATQAVVSGYVSRIRAGTD